MNNPNSENDIELISADEVSKRFDISPKQLVQHIINDQLKVYVKEHEFNFNYFGVKNCPECGANANLSETKCAKCGFQFDEAEEPPTRFCKICESPVDLETKVCSGCDHEYDTLDDLPEGWPISVNYDPDYRLLTAGEREQLTSEAIEEIYLLKRQLKGLSKS